MELPAPAQQLLASTLNFLQNLTSPPLAATHHIVAGSFRSPHLVLLEFSPLNRTLELVQNVDVPEDAPGPYQYLGLNPSKDRVYTTSWALPPKLSSWRVDADAVSQNHGGDASAQIGLGTEGSEESRQPWWSWSLTHLNSVPITATSSYITVPPPYTHMYSMGGPTGEAHFIDRTTGAISDKLQEVLFVPPDQLAKADKTRIALRTGSHGIEFSPVFSLAFVPVLGTNTIEVYKHNPPSGKLTHLHSSPSPRGENAHDGPRHVKVHPNGRILYCITEHSNLIDLYQISPTSPYLTHLSSVSLLPPSLSFSNPSFRGDTIHLVPSTPSHPSPRALFATTRGGKEDVRGWVSVFELDEDGKFVSPLDASHEPSQHEGEGEEKGVERYQAPTSGGKAHALDILSKSQSSSQSISEQGVWILLTDDSDFAARQTGGGGVRVLEWDGWGTGGIREVVGWPKPRSQHEGGDEREGVWFEGGSHAVWLD
ncbi:hypothetical protein AX16_002451 [Volvariella volvacea WC 439]|nr:hypothetical protein AX16_002451 [Volvariella volvacea WC 439]